MKVMANVVGSQLAYSLSSALASHFDNSGLAESMNKKLKKLKGFKVKKVSYISDANNPSVMMDLKLAYTAEPDFDEESDDTDMLASLRKGLSGSGFDINDLQASVNKGNMVYVYMPVISLDEVMVKGFEAIKAQK